jgi:transcriptional regulator with XRE-family HTH domain
MKEDKMAVRPSPTVRRKRLGIELRRLREQSGLTCEEVGKRLDCSGTRVSRVETGVISVKPGDVRELLEVYGIKGEEADALVQLARDARKKGWWHTYGDVLPKWFEAYLGFEAEAARISAFKPLVIPGLLQNEGYARAVLHAAPDASAADEVDRQVALRMERQAILTRTRPVDFWVILSETALRVQVGSPDVMRGQLQYLIEMAERPNITLQVLPFSTAAHVNPVSPFTILELPATLDPTVVHLEHLTGSLFLERAEEIRRYTVVFDHLRAEAHGMNRSIALISQVAEELR